LITHRILFTDRFNIIHYLRTFAKFPDVADEEIKNMNLTYNLSQVTIAPNKISVIKSEQKLEEESALINMKIESVKNYILANYNNENAALLQKSVLDINKVIKSFVSSGSSVSFDKFVKSVSQSPINFGYKPTVLKFTNTEWKVIFDYLKSVTS